MLSTIITEYQFMKFYYKIKQDKQLNVYTNNIEHQHNIESEVKWKWSGHVCS